MLKTMAANKLYTVLVSVTVTLVAAGVFFQLFAQSIRNLQNDLADDMFELLEFAANDVFSILVPLNEYEFTECSEDNLRIMESALFNAAYAKQIMFYQDDIGLCSTVSGIFAKPVVSPPADFVSLVNGAEIWINREVELDFTGEILSTIVIKLGNYSTMTDPGFFTLQNTGPFTWEFFFRDTGAPTNWKHISGTRGVYQVANTLHDSADNSLTYFEACDEVRLNLCLALRSSTSVLANEYAKIIALLALCSLAIGNIGAYWFNAYLRGRQSIASRLIHGFDNNAYYWLYQPIVDMETKSVIGCEILSRFADHYGQAMPDDYLPELRKAEYTSKFTRLMIKSALVELEHCRDLPDNFKVCLNIFPADIISGQIEDIIAMAEIRQSRFSLTLEITEEEYLDEISTQNRLENIHKTGLSISIDDFGTGYSNLTQLKKLNCSYLKVDRSYIADLEEEPIRSSLIPHIINMADQLDMTVIAEGIETFEQQVILVGLGIKYGQGGYFGAPMTLPELVNQLKNRNQADTAHAVILDS